MRAETALHMARQAPRGIRVAARSANAAARPMTSVATLSLAARRSRGPRKTSRSIWSPKRSQPKVFGRSPTSLARSTRRRPRWGRERFGRPRCRSSKKKKHLPTPTTDLTECLKLGPQLRSRMMSFRGCCRCHRKKQSHRKPLRIDPLQAVPPKLNHAPAACRWLGEQILERCPSEEFPPNGALGGTCEIVETNSSSVTPETMLGVLSGIRQPNSAKFDQHAAISGPIRANLGQPWSELDRCAPVPVAC